MTPVATGLAMAQTISAGERGICVVFIGDGTLGEGVLYEAMNIASKQQVPLLVVCENNLFAQSTSQTQTLAGDICAVRRRSASRPRRRTHGIGRAFST